MTTTTTNQLPRRMATDPHADIHDWVTVTPTPFGKRPRRECSTCETRQEISPAKWAQMRREEDTNR